VHKFFEIQLLARESDQDRATMPAFCTDVFTLERACETSKPIAIIRTRKTFFIGVVDIIDKGFVFSHFASRFSVFGCFWRYTIPIITSPATICWFVAFGACALPFDLE
jgi:hypothetical protein